MPSISSRPSLLSLSDAESLLPNPNSIVGAFTIGLDAVCCHLDSGGIWRHPLVRKAMPADAKHEDPSLMPAAPARTAGARNIKRAREGANLDVIATIVLFSLNLFCELMGLTDTENPKVGRQWEHVEPSGVLIKARRCEQKLQIWMSAKLRWSRKLNENKTFPALMHAEQRKQGPKRRYACRPSCMLKPASKCVFSIRRTHYLLHHYDVIKCRIWGSPKSFPLISSNARPAT